MPAQQMIEPLESRRLCAVTAVITATQTLKIRGDDGDNLITFVIPEGGDLIIQADGKTLGPFLFAAFGEVDLKTFDGNDTVNGDASDGSVGIPGQGFYYGGKGNDHFNDFGASFLVAVFGGPGKDRIEAWGCLSGGGGDDRIFGGELSNYVICGSGDDKFVGGPDSDYILGGKGSDTIDGGTGGQSDSMAGGAGDDLLIGRGGPDFLYGQAGNDTLKGGAGDDTGYGGADPDVIDGGAGFNFFFQEEAGNITELIDELEAIIHGVLPGF